MDYKDYYKVLEIRKDANEADIKRAYRKLARKYHPDVSKEKNAEERFKEVNEAYEVLKDPEKRAAYDQLGANWKAGQDFKPPPGWNAGFEFSGGDFTGGDTSGFSDFFSSLFGQGFGSAQNQRSDYRTRGEDHHAKIMIDLEDAYQGATRSISLRAPELNPQGQISTKHRTLNIKIPKGIKQGQKIRLSGQGSAAISGGTAGDLYLEIEFNPHSIYSVEAHDVYLTLPLTPWEAALGATVKIPTPEGQVDLKIPAETRSGQKLRLKGRGIPAKQPGDLYVIAQITLPPANTETAREFYQKMQQQLDYNPRQQLGV